MNSLATAMAAASVLMLAGCGGGGAEDRTGMADPTPMSEIRVIDADTVDVDGWALAYRQFSRDYVDEEEEARSNRRGIHRGEFVEPWDWRRGGRLEGGDRFAAVASEALDADALADRMLRGEDGNVYAHWLDRSVFAMVDDTVAVSFGDFPATDPARIGGGVWTGAMVGMDTVTRERVEGVAEIGIDDFARPDVNIALTGMRDAHGRARADLLWRDIPMARGHFRASDQAGSVEGRFYGSDHEEAGGIFRRDRLVGAFGGSRRRGTP